MRMASVDWNAAHQVQKWMQQWLAIKFLVDDVADRPAPTSQLQDEGVYPADVIGQQKKSAGRQILKAVRRDPINAAQDGRRNGVQHAFGGGRARHVCDLQSASGQLQSAIR